jgi:hypothetical protein
LLAASPDGCTEALLLANGFTVEPRQARDGRGRADDGGRPADRGGAGADHGGRAKGAREAVKPSRSIRDDPEHWRQRAKEARDIAEQMSDPVSREMMLQIGKEYEQIRRECAAATAAKPGPAQMTRLILKRAPIGPNLEDYNVLADGVVVGRIFLSPAAPQDRPWMWASGHSAASVNRAAHGYEPTQEAAMAAFAMT